MERKVYEFISQTINDPIVEWKKCPWTGQDFPVFQGDIDLLKKISPKIGGVQYGLPLPTLSPKARQIRRLMRRNDRKIYKTKCMKTSKDIISFYHPDIEKKIVELNEWYKSVDNTNLGKEFDFSRTFTQQFGELLDTTLKENVLNVGFIENSVYTHNAGDMKNCYMVFDTGMVENSLYGVRITESKNVVDGFEVKKSEHVYDGHSVHKSTNVMYSQDMENCSFCAFTYRCRGCHYCIGCTNLENKTYCVFNQQVSKEEFKKTWAELFDGRYSTVEKFKIKFDKILQKTPRKNLNMINCEGSIGHNLVNCKNVLLSEEMIDIENFRYSSRINSAGKTADCMDIDSRGWNMNTCYELNCCGSDFSTSTYNTQFGSYLFRGVSDAQYCTHIPRTTEYVFGCTDIQGKKYCILNKQYTKHEYETLVPKIIEKMKADPAKDGAGAERGEFFDPAICPFPYNDTIAHDYYPIKTLVYPDGTEKEVCRYGEGKVFVLQPEKNISPALLDLGGSTKISIKRRTKEHEITVPEGMQFILAKDLSDNIADINDDILDKAIICKVSGRPFRISKLELEFYRKHGIPLPRKHYDIRHMERLAQKPRRELHLRTCDKCGIEMLSVYPSESEFKVYCEACYNKEIY